MHSVFADPGLWRRLALADTVALQIAIDGGVAAVVAAMEACSDSQEVQVYGCWALANIAWNEGACEYLRCCCSGRSCTSPNPFQLRRLRVLCGRS